MPCINCGGPLKYEDDIFCPKCYNEAVAKNAGEVQNAEAVEKEPVKKKRPVKKIIVSVIASDFDKDFDFTVVPSYDKPFKTKSMEEINIDNNDNKVVSEEKNDDNIADDILPNFLKGINID